MNEHFLEKFNSQFLYDNTFSSLVVIIVPFDYITLFVIAENSAFSHSRTCGITHHIFYTRTNIIRGRSFSVLLLFGIDIISVFLVDIALVSDFIKLFAKVLDQKTVQFIRPCLPEICIVKIFNSFVCLFLRIINHFRNESMNVRVPVERSSKSVNCGNHTKHILIFEIAVKIVIVFVVSNLTVFLPFSLFCRWIRSVLCIKCFWQRHTAD